MTHLDVKWNSMLIFNELGGGGPIKWGYHDYDSCACVNFFTFQPKHMHMHTQKYINWWLGRGYHYIQ